MTDEEWGPWIGHNCGRYAALKNGVYAQMIGKSGAVREGPVKTQDQRVWENVVRYRIRKPKGLSLLQQIAADVTTPIKEDA